MSNNAKLISVIIPVHNQGEYLDQCLNSVVNQTYKNLQIICVDDGSTDLSPLLLKDWAAKDARIRVICQKNAGAGAARNNGLGYAVGDYVHFLDSDDWLEPDAYKCLISHAERADLDIIVFLYRRYDNITKVLRDVRLFSGADGSKRVVSFEGERQHFFNTSVVPWNKLYKRAFLNNLGAKFDEIKVGNDRGFYIRTISYSSRILLLSEYLINYRVNNRFSLVGAGRLKNIDDIILASRKVDDFFANQSEEIRIQALDFNMRDILHFYNAASTYDKKAAVPKLAEYFKSLVLLDNEKALHDYRWWPPVYIIRNIIKIEEMETIPVVMATNDNYAPYLDVAIISISQTLAANLFCDVYVFHSGLSDSYVEILNSTELHNIRVICINIKSYIESAMDYTRAHFSIEMYYRLFISELLAFYEKVLYLDCDLIVNRDLGELFGYDIGEFIIGGVNNFYNESMYRWVVNMLKLPPENYINSGVLIINTERFRSAEIRKKCIEELTKWKFLACPDQDVINLMCRGEIMVIDSGWNYQWHHGALGNNASETIDFSKEQLENAQAKRYIVHYTSGVKAWSHPLYEGAELFWKHARSSRFYLEILSRNIKLKIEKIKEKFGSINKG